MAENNSSAPLKTAIPTDVEAFEHFVSDCDGAGIQYDGPSYEQGFLSGKVVGMDAAQAAPAAVAVPDEREELAKRLDSERDYLEAIKLPPHNPTLAIEDILNEYEGDDREEVWESIKAYAEGQARGAVLIERKSLAATPALPATEPACAAVGLTDALRDLIEAIEYTPLGIRQIKALERARAAIKTEGEIPATEDSSAGDQAEVPDGFGSAEHWKEKAQYWAGVAHELRGQALRGEPLDGIIQPTSQAEVQAEPVALQMCSELRPRTESEKAAYLAGVADGRMYAERDADTAPQAQPADAAIAEKAAKYDRLVPYLCKTCSGFGIVGGHCQDGSFDSQPCPDCNQPTHTLTQAVLDVLAERARQIEDKGYEPEADDVYEDAQLAAAAATYALLATGADGWRVDDHWPWSAELSLKKGEPRRMLEKAGALILAEMERLDRAAAAQEGGKA